MAKGMFKKRVAAKPPILGYILAWALTDSYYDEYAIEEALREAFSAPDCLGSLFEEPYTSNPNSHTRAMTDLKVGVTAVNAITELTTLMTNYNRKTSDDGKLDLSSRRLVGLLINAHRQRAPSYLPAR